MKNFMNGFWSGMRAFGPVMGGAIGGMLLYRGAGDGDIVCLLLSVIVISVNMVSNWINTRDF